MSISQEELKRQHIFKMLDQIKSDAAYERTIITALLMDYELIDLEAITQKGEILSTGNIRIDLFYPKLKLAIEIDEDHHEHIIKEDTNRDCELMTHSGITTHRIRLWGSHQQESLWNKIARCKNTILEFQKNINPAPWSITQHSVSAAKADHDNTIFKKINTPIYSNNQLLFDVKIHRNIMQAPQINTLNIGVYTGQTSEIATVITIPKNDLQPLGGGNYRVSGSSYINEEHPLNQSGFTESNWENGKSVFYSNNLNSLVNPSSSVNES